MMDPTIIDHLLFVVFTLIFPLWALRFGFRRLKVAQRSELPRIRLSVYRVGMTLQWTLTAAVIAVWLINARPWSHIGLVPLLTPGLAGVTIGFIVITWYVVRQRNDAMIDDESLEQVRRRMRNIEQMIPRDGRELRAFSGLSITAGICEEIMYRGFLIWYLSHWLELIPAAAVAALIFGFGHAYQGWRGILLTAAVGAFLGAVYLISGSLFVPMLIHALMDIHSGHLAMIAFKREEYLIAEEEARRVAELRERAEQLKLIAEQEAVAARREEAEPHESDASDHHSGEWP